jgi:hypothetical protein
MECLKALLQQPTENRVSVEQEQTCLKMSQFLFVPEMHEFQTLVFRWSKNYCPWHVPGEPCSEGAQPAVMGS